MDDVKSSFVNCVNDCLIDFKEATVNNHDKFVNSLKRLTEHAMFEKTFSSGQKYTIKDFINGKLQGNRYDSDIIVYIDNVRNIIVYLQNAQNNS